MPDPIQLEQALATGQANRDAMVAALGRFGVPDFGGMARKGLAGLNEAISGFDAKGKPVPQTLRALTLAMPGSAANVVTGPLSVGTAMASMLGKAPAGALGANALRRGSILPTDDASRMARAQEMGFDVDTPLFHGSPDARGIHEEGFATLQERFNDLPREGPFFFTNNRNVANSFADDRRAFDFQGADPEVIEAFVRQKNPLVVDAGGAQFRNIGLDAVRKALKDGPELDNFENMLRNMPEHTSSGKISTDGVASIAKRFGRDGVVVKNVRDSFTGEGPPSDVVMVFGAKNIRSPNALFDPAKSDSADILASNALPTVVPGAEAFDGNQGPNGGFMFLGEEFF